MGKWQLEVAKMALYMIFPVASFYAYHQVDWFEDNFKDIQGKIYSKENMETKKELSEFIEKLREHRERKVQSELVRLQAESVNKNMSD
ncbi:protein PET100 homolog, mitochondrial-like [Eurytemora carolleeae]|uniref:protein PET100 homolog, mitochondrial-like n=1 Tax=Eurytemora carolleeae TaxID=1294199 RepID=UPI000C76577B|nr:protein PET100 homolog, mitochondrial-like [Eurytemora carolleeae]|eukprot:XP_023342038.1 protein PET100 homolog, mitochondrial-like [Eurytemora affinis]